MKFFITLMALTISTTILAKQVELKISTTYKKSDTTTKSYHHFGVAQVTQTERHHFDDSYIGIGLRYENRFFIEVEPRKSKVVGTIQTITYRELLLTALRFYKNRISGREMQ